MSSKEKETKVTDNVEGEQENKKQETQETPDSTKGSSESDNEAKETTEKPDPLAEAETKIAELQDKYLRQAAEFDNYRKRTLKEKTELILNGSEKAIIAILPVVDDLERALKNLDEAKNDNAKEGVSLIHQKFMKILGELGVKRIEAMNADFDTNLHHAIAQIPAPTEDLKGKVIDCVKTGYTLNDKVIRHAQVAVGI